MKATTEAIRSMLECIASLRIATEPVIAPAATLSRMSALLEAIESAAALVLAGRGPAPTARGCGAGATIPAGGRPELIRPPRARARATRPGRAPHARGARPHPSPRRRAPPWCARRLLRLPRPPGR